MLREYGLQLYSSLDEQQLVAIDVIENLIDCAEVNSYDTTLEIGAGCGNITVPLATKSGKVVAVEKNPKFIPLLKERTSKLTNVDIIQGDILTSKIPSFTSLVSNLPYSICEAVFNKLIHHNFRKATFIVSSSFADIIMAKPEEQKYSRLSLISNIFYIIEKIYDIPPDSYYPQPGVKTSMITMKPVPASSVTQEILCFLLRCHRMKLKNVLREAIINSSQDHEAPITKRKARNEIRSMNLDTRILDTRVASLSLDDILTLAEALNDHI